MNSSPEPSSNAGFIAESLDVLSREHLEAYLGLCRRMAGHEVLLNIDGEAVTLAFTPHQASLLSLPEKPSVTVQTSRRSLLEVIDGQLSLERAVYQETVILQGHVQDVGAFYDGLRVYVQGAVRCPSFPFLLERYRRKPFPITSSPK